MNSNNNPSLDPANNGTLAGSIRFAFNKLMQSMDGVLPARVIKFDRNANRVQVQILLSMLTTDGSVVSRSQIASIPVLVFGGGGFMLNFNLSEGDLGWVIANDRDISLFLQSYEESKPNTARKNSFSDAVFIPDVMRGFEINEEDAENAVLQSVDGTVRVSLSPNKIKLTAPTVEVDGSFVINGSITGVGNVILTGNLGVIGNITATGTITPGTPP